MVGGGYSEGWAGAIWGRPFARRVRGVAVVFLTVLLSAGCAAPKVSTAPPTATRSAPAASDRDRLLDDMAACQLRRLSQTDNAPATDAVVLAALGRYRVTPEQLSARAQAMLPELRRQGDAFARTGDRACTRLAEHTGVTARLIRIPEAEPPRMKSGGVWVRYDGDISDGLAAQITARLRQERAVGLIVNSRGGSVSEARKIGRYLRANGLSVAVDKMCASACIDVLAGGVSRYVTPAARIGLHQSSAPSDLGNHNTGQSYVAGSAQYLRDMGVDPEVALAAASVPPNKMYWISASEAIKARLATNLVRSF
jgi:hypothetical protein